MQNAYLPLSATSRVPSLTRYVPKAKNRFGPNGREGRDDNQFVAMLNAYRYSGGLARAEEVVALFERRNGPDIATLARWIVDRRVISFAWQLQTWLPLFQFNRFDMTPHPELGQVFAELTSVYDPWELADWFARPNASLADRSPAEMLGLDLAAVLNAARADRFIASA